MSDRPDRSAERGEDDLDTDVERLRRERMVDGQIEHRGVRDTRVLAAMRAVPRHLFVSEAYRNEAYEDHPLPIGEGQTISQPYIVALMSELAEVGPGDKVLEVGTGCGYQTAVLVELGARVLSLEIVRPLVERARENLRVAGYDAWVEQGDGYRGWSEEAPFDVIILTAAPPEVPEPLLEQLALGGRLIAPVGRDPQQLVVITRGPRGLTTRPVLPVRFVPMTGQASSD